MQDETEGKNRLIEVLSNRFPEEATELGTLLHHAYQAGTITYDDINLDPTTKEDIILIASQARMVVPLGTAPAWEDRVLMFDSHETYHMPKVVRILVQMAEEEGKWQPETAEDQCLREAGEPNISKVLNYLSMIKTISPDCRISLEVMDSLRGELGISLQFHKLLDELVQCGIMSTYSRKSLFRGTPQYEVNASLYWAAP
ncbi:MAG: hypothetical protein ACLFVK_02505 [Dehalococcoidia bacterium]